MGIFLLQNLLNYDVIQEKKMLTSREQILLWYCVLRVAYTNFQFLTIYVNESNESPSISKSKKSPTLVGLNIERLLKPFN